MVAFSMDFDIANPLSRGTVDFVGFQGMNANDGNGAEPLGAQGRLSAEDGCAFENPLRVDPKGIVGGGDEFFLNVFVGAHR